VASPLQNPQILAVQAHHSENAHPVFMFGLRDEQVQSFVLPVSQLVSQV